MKHRSNELPRRIRRYLAWQELCCKASTVGTYRVALKPFCTFLISEMKSHTITRKKIALLTKRHLQKYLRILCYKPLAAYSRVNYLLAIRKYLEWEVLQRTIDERILYGFDRHAIPKVPEYLPRPLSVENDRIIAEKLAKSEHHYAPMFRLLRLTGMRISELINLPTDCMISIPDGGCFLKIPLGKMNNERMVPLHQEAIDIIDTIKHDASHASVHTDRLIGVDGSIASVYSRLRYRFKKITDDIIDQGKPVTFHRMRHTYATSLLSAGVGILSIMKLLGHRRIEMTMRYTKVVPSHLRDEYLKAIDALKNDWAPPGDEAFADQTSRLNPTKLIGLLKTSIRKTDSLDFSKQRNLIKRLDRIKADLIATTPIFHASSPHKSAGRLAG